MKSVFYRLNIRIYPWDVGDKIHINLFEVFRQNSKCNANFNLKSNSVSLEVYLIFKLELESKHRHTTIP